MMLDNEGSYMEIDGIRIPIEGFSMELEETSIVSTGRSPRVLPDPISCEIPIQSLELSRPILPGIVVPICRVDYREDGSSETTIYPTRRN